MKYIFAGLALCAAACGGGGDKTPTGTGKTVVSVAITTPLASISVGSTETLTATALDGLPAKLSYLRHAILAIGRQDQDLLGCGEADTAVLAKAIVVRAREEGFDANAEADALHDWLQQQAVHDAAWAGPVPPKMPMRIGQLLQIGRSYWQLPVRPALPRQRLSMPFAWLMQRLCCHLTFCALVW